MNRVFLALSLTLALSLPGLAQYSYTSIANSTQTAPGSAALFSGIAAPVVNGDGDVVFVAGPTSARAYYNYPIDGSGARLLGQTDSVPAGAGGGSFNSLNTLPSLSDSDTLTFASTTTGGAGGGLFQRDSTGVVTSVMQRGQSAAGGTGTYNASAQYRASNNGSVVFQSTITGGSASQGLFRRLSGGSLVRLADTSTAAPITGGGRFLAFAPGGMNDSGESAFFGAVTDNLNIGAGIFTADASGLISRITEEGASVPGFENAFFTTLTRPTIGEGGQVVFRGVGDNGTNIRGGLFLFDNGLLSAIALGNQAAPGGGTFDAAATSFSLASRVSDTGATAFRAVLNGTSSSAGVFVSSKGTLSRVLGVGDSLFNDTVTVVGTPSVDDQGNVVVDYGLSNGQTGILRATILTSAPEPGTLALLSLAALPIAGALRRKHKKGASQHGL